MGGRRSLLAIGTSMSFVLLTATAAVAQDEAAVDATVDVTAVEYAFQGLPTSVPAGTSLRLTNGGQEVHEMILVRIADDVTASLDELLTMEEDPIELGMVEMVGSEPLFAAPGAVAEGTAALEREGRYVAICFVPQGLTDFGILAQLGPDTDPADIPEDVQAILANPPHFTLGMVQEFTVTAPGTEPGPLPAAADEPMSEEPAAEEAAGA